MASIGEQIISARKARNMTQETLAKLMFVSRPTVSRWETDSVTPNAQALQRLSEVLGVRFGTWGRFFRPGFRTIIRRVQAKILVGKWDKRTVRDH